MASSNNVVELVVKLTDSFTEPLHKVHDALDELSRKFTGMSVEALVSIGSVIEGFSKMYEESSQAELALVRFSAAFDAMGAHVGIASEEMRKFGEEMKLVTRFSEEQVMAAQTILLRYGDVQGVVFQRAQKMSLDLAEAMGTDASSAAMMLGRALENPLQSMRLLRQVGVTLNDTQKEQIKAFMDSGQQMQAQKIILDELSKRYDGLAEKIGKTTVGSVAELKHAWDDIFKVPEKLTPLTEAVGGLTDALRNPVLVEGIHTVFETMINLASSALGVITSIINALNNPALDSWRNLGNAAFNTTRFGQAGSPIGGTNINAAPTSIFDTQKITPTTSSGGTSLWGGPTITPMAGGSGGYDETTSRDASVLKAKELADAEAAKQAAFDKEVAGWQRVQEATDALNTQLTSVDEEIVKAAEHTPQLAKEMEQVVRMGEAVGKTLTNADYSKAQLQAIGKIQSAFASMFMAVGSGIRGMLTLFLQALEQMVAEAAAAKIADSLFGATDANGHRSSGGSDSVWGKAILKVLGFATGGDAPAGLKIVGENGPELLSTGPGRIWNSQQLAAALPGGGGAINYAPSTTINVAGSMDSATQKQIYTYIEATRSKDQRELVRTLQRNGYRNLR